MVVLRAVIRDLATGPSATRIVQALDYHGSNAGLASSLGSTMQMVAAGVLVGAAGPFLDRTVVLMQEAIALCGVLALGLSLMNPRQAAVA